MNNNTITFAAVTTWINTNIAKTKRAELIASGLDKSQVKLSSYRWADLNDKSKGYLCRVLVVKGLRPDLECGETRPRKQVTVEPIGKFATEQVTGNSITDSHTMTYAPYLPEVKSTRTA